MVHSGFIYVKMNGAPEERVRSLCTACALPLPATQFCVHCISLGPVSTPLKVDLQWRPSQAGWIRRQSTTTLRRRACVAPGLHTVNRVVPDCSSSGRGTAQVMFVYRPDSFAQN